jgi:hypothetical protein
MSNFAYPHMRAAEVNHNGPRSKCDQVIYEAIAKACEIVVSSRVTHASDAGSSRFNLHIPEISQVRSILQAWRLTLHVPIRLDVYYQHEGDRRELLERWCLEYKPTSTEHFIQTEGVVTQDPIVQLRHVCKRIVLWLRTLYCWTRLLPAQALNKKGVKSPIGFSIYVNSERKDDITDLTQNQGFRWQRQPSSVVSPYGELEWKVIYSSSVSRLVALQKPTKSVAISIPVSNTPSQSESDGRQMIRHSAPSHFATMRAKSFNSSNDHHLTRPRLINDQQNTYDPSSFVRPVHHSTTAAGFSPHGVLKRRHTSVGQESAPTVETGNPQAPERILSGLSLAMMSLNQDDDDDDDESFNIPSDEPELPSDAVIRRHAALHQVPLHVLEQQQSHHHPVPASREYGYGYNNHIAWQTIQPSISKPVVGRSFSDLSDNNNTYSKTPTYSSSFLGSTPPSAAFLGATPPTISSFPRPGSTMMTPPFKPRPMGFVHEPLNVSSLIPPQTGAAHSVENKSGPLQPQTSLDLLHSSPFQQQAQLTSLVSSFAAFADGTGLNSSLVDRTLWNSGAPSRSQREDDEFYEEDIPFAVEEDTVSATMNQSPGSSLMYASSAVASFAQKCTASQRLSIFESDAAADVATPLMDNVADKLSEFRSFDASLQASSRYAGGNSSAAVSLRT